MLLHKSSPRAHDRLSQNHNYNNKKIFTEVTGLRSEAQGTYEPNIVQKLKKFLIFIASCTWQRKIEDYKYSGGNKCHFWQIFVAELELLPIRIIQSKASANTHE